MRLSSQSFLIFVGEDEDDDDDGNAMPSEYDESLAGSTLPDLADRRTSRALVSHNDTRKARFLQTTVDPP